MSLRKDIFIAGARLLGLWQLLGAVNSLALIVSSWFNTAPGPSFGQDFSSLHLLVQIITGAVLLFWTNTLFRLLSHLMPEGEKGDDVGMGVDESD